MKKVTALIVALCMLMGLFCVNAGAQQANGADSDAATWETVLYIPGMLNYMTDGTVVFEMQFQAVQKPGFLSFIMKQYTAQARCLVYTYSGSSAVYYTEETTLYFNEDFEQFLNKNTQAKAIYDTAEKLYETEQKMIICSTVDAQGRNASSDQVIAALESLQQNARNSIAELVSEYEREMKQEIVTSAIESAITTVGTCVDEGDPVLNLIKDWVFGLIADVVNEVVVNLGFEPPKTKDTTFENNIEGIMAHNAIGFVDGMTGRLNSAMKTIDPEFVIRQYRDECQRYGQDLVNSMSALLVA